MEAGERKPGEIKQYQACSRSHRMAVTAGKHTCVNEKGQEWSYEDQMWRRHPSWSTLCSEQSEMESKVEINMWVQAGRVEWLKRTVTNLKQTTAKSLEKISKIVARFCKISNGVWKRLAFRRPSIQLQPFPLPSFILFVEGSTRTSISQPNDPKKPTNPQHQCINLSFVSNSLNQTSFQTQRFLLIFHQPY